MSESFFFNIIILLVSALILGEVFKRIKLPALVGYLLAGVIIGPSLLNIVQPSESFKVITDVAIFFLMFLAGLHLRPEEILNADEFTKQGKRLNDLWLCHIFSLETMNKIMIQFILDFKFKIRTKIPV